MISTKVLRTDVAELAEMHQEAFPGFFLSGLGSGFLRQFYLGFVGDDTAVVAILRDDKGIMRAMAVGTIEPKGFFRRLLVKQISGLVRESVRASLRNPRVLGRLVKASMYRGDSRAFTGALLSSICVDPKAQSQGFGSEVMSAWVQRAREMGALDAYLTTDADGNDLVNAAYVKWGWHVVEQFTTKEGRHMNRYAKKLWQSGPLKTKSDSL